MRYLTVFITILGLDLGIKNHIEDHLEEKEQRSKCGGFLLIQKYHNKGAFLNAGQKMPWLVAVLSVALTLLLTILFAVSLTKAGSSTLKWGLTMLLGGA